MGNKKIENIILTIISIRGLFLLIFNQITIIDLIVGSTIAFLLIVLYQKSNLKKYKIWQVLCLIIFIIIITYLLYMVSLFIKDNLLKNVPLIIILISLLCLMLYLVLKGYDVYIKVLELSTYIILLLGITSIILLIPYIDFTNINNTINLSLTINSLYFALFFFIIYLSLNYLNNYTLNYKNYIIGILNIFLIKLLMILTLSQTLINIFKYPYISMFKKISFFDFLERLETILSIQFLFDYFLLLTMILISIKHLIKNIFIKKIDKISTHQ